jgi:hypothetical protein
MDIHQKIVFETKHGNHTFSFCVPSAATWGEALDASFAFMNAVKDNIAKSIQDVDQKSQGENDGTI